MGYIDSNSFSEYNMAPSLYHLLSFTKGESNCTFIYKYIYNLLLLLFNEVMYMVYL